MPSAPMAAVGAAGGTFGLPGGSLAFAAKAKAAGQAPATLKTPLDQLIITDIPELGLKAKGKPPAKPKTPAPAPGLKPSP
jgi:hypothetical protein